jgi:endonuclease/exonuclease/phosphatase (EEP) superfamily protein YafD
MLNLVNKYNPDLFITTETDIIWQKALSSLEEQFPHRVMVPQSNTYGLHLYSKLELEDSEVRFLVEPDIPSIKTSVVLRSGERIRLYIVHPRPPVPSEATHSKERDAEIILVAKEAEKENRGVIVAGDFNDVAWSETTELFQEVSGFLDPRRGRGFYNTFHAHYPIFRWPLDHLFHSNHFKLVELERLGNVGSDHFPMLIALNYIPEEKADQPEVDAEADTEEKADETIRQGLEEGDKSGK